MQATTARPMPWNWLLAVQLAVSTEKPCLNRTMAARQRMQATESRLEDQGQEDETRMSLKATNQHDRGADGEEEDRMDRTVVADGVEELSGEDGEPA